MALPVNIDELIHGKVVEWERIEFKSGWNPEDVIHSVCAFTNDFNNWGGGYIVIGIEEENHRPILPPKGLSESEVGVIQRKLLELCNLLLPPYFPIFEPVEYQAKLIGIIWVPGGQNRPYKAPVSLSSSRRDYRYYVRHFNNTVVAKPHEERELIALAATIPFDDRMNQHAEITDLKLPLIQDFLKDIKSDLYQQTSDMTLEEIGHQMAIIDGPKEYLKPRNVGLMFFKDHPETFFLQSQIDVVIFPEGSGGDTLTEKIFTGPIHYQLRDALAFIQNSIVEAFVKKLPDRAESIRYFNYPYAAIEEALVNAIYHRSYEIPEPVEVRVNPEKIEIVSYPGPDRSIKDRDLKRGQLVARRYRNRRIGEFLKELDLIEGRCTGIPKMIRALKNNGSPAPEFETDDDRSYFITRLHIHPEAQVKAQVEAQVEAQEEAQFEITDTQKKILIACEKAALSSSDIVNMFGHSGLSGNIKKAISQLLDDKLIQYTIPEKPKSSLQKYRITDKGKKVIKIRG